MMGSSAAEGVESVKLIAEADGHELRRRSSAEAGRARIARSVGGAKNMATRSIGVNAHPVNTSEGGVSSSSTSSS